MKLRYSTVAGNSASTGGGIGGALLLEAEGSILTGNSPTQCEDVSPPVATGANIVFGSSACSFTGAPPANIDPKLGPLSQHGGIGATLALLPGSPALNSGGATCPAAGGLGLPVDERGVTRPRGAACDLGAFESAADAAVTLTAVPTSATVNRLLSIVATASNAGTEPLSGVMVTVPVPPGSTFHSAPAGCVAAFATTTTVICELGSLAPAEARAVAVEVQPERTGVLAETASVSSAQADYNAANNSAAFSSVVVPASAAGAGASARAPRLTLPPRLTLLSETNATFAAGAAATPLTGRTSRRHPRGTRFAFQLDMAATVAVAIQSQTGGRRVGGLCRAATKSLLRRPRCTLFRKVGTLARTGHAGSNHVVFTGRVGGKTLHPGRYRAIFTATDAAGTSSPATIAFAVVAR
jgi:Domain of unknown function DUF11